MNNLIVPRLIGGMCNQFFQVAAAYAYARKHGYSFAINYDCGWYSMSTKGMREPLEYRDTVYSNLPETNILPENIYTQPSFSYSEISPTDGDLSLSGYFQTEKYFYDYRDEIKELFCFDSAHDCSHLVGDNTVGIHIRRGDYTTIPTVLGILDEGYYARAIKEIGDYDNIVICTDDPDWAYERFGSLCQISNFSSEIDDLNLLSQCKKVIMSNSSFSWWGAYLGVDKEKVIAPSKWFGPDGYQDYEDIYLKDWNRI